MGHPSVIVDKDLSEELIKNLSKKELIEEVEYLKRQREELIIEIQKKASRTRELERELNEFKLDVENKEFPGHSKYYRNRQGEKK